ncbi:MAG: Fur family transcriptional regulator [Rubritalea sp.]|uniref:Fur family transcriptional regulator n=1 Tax=Rubritalea sp. TaxID=2109375 RepID=UPI0032425435
MLAEIQEKLNSFLKTKGLRSTPQRNAIIDIIFESDEHFTADEIWDRIRRANSKASRATVYRTLALLVEADLLHEIDLGEDTKTYDPNFNDKPSHNHLICIDCGKVLEFEDSHIELLNDCLTRRMGFRPKSQSIRIEANCEILRTKGACQNLLHARLAGKRLPKKR